MQETSRPDIYDQVRQLLDEGQTGEALAILSTLPPADKAGLFESLDSETQQSLLPDIDASDAADILEELDDPATAEFAGRLDVAVLSRFLDEMEPDKAADLLGDLTAEQRAAALEGMRTSGEVRPLLRYPDDSAGGLMTSAFYAFPESARVETVLQRIRQEPAGGEEIPYVYVLGERGVLAGVTRLTDLIRAHPDQTLGTTAREEVISIRVDEDREVVGRLANHYDLMALPVVDARGRLVGVITADDAMAVQAEETSEDIYRSAGIVGREAARSDLLIRGALWRILLVRVPFLVVTLIGGMLAGAVIGVYEEALESVVALALFFPMVMAMGGNAGIQSSAVFIRAHALGQVDTSRFLQHLLREMAIGMGMGVIFGVLAGVAVLLWQGIPALGLVVGLALVATLTLATFMGFAMPYALIRLGLDPAAGADPLITTVNDVTGLFVYFFLAYRLLGQLM